MTQAARGLADRRFRVVVAGDACTEMGEEMREVRIPIFSLPFGWARKTAEVVKLFHTTPAAQKTTA